MPPDLPPHILIALGLLGCPGSKKADTQPCLNIAIEETDPDPQPCLDVPPDEDTEPVDQDVGPCLEMAPEEPPAEEPPPKPHLGPCLKIAIDPDSKPVDKPKKSTDGDGADASEVLRRLEGRQVLPADVLARLKKRA